MWGWRPRIALLGVVFSVADIPRGTAAASPASAHGFTISEGC